LDDEVFAQGVRDALDGGEAHVLSVILQPRDGGLSGLGALR